MNKKELEKFIKHIEELVGLSVFYDPDEPENNILFFGEFQEIGIEVNDTLDSFSIFTSYAYDDIPDSEENEYKEEKDTLKRTYLEEKGFELFLRNKAEEYPVSVWDDGCFMCPGIVIRIGFSDILFSDDAVVLFCNLLNTYYKKICNKSNLELQKYIAIMICNRYGYADYDNAHIFLNRNTSITFTKQRYICNESIQQY